MARVAGVDLTHAYNVPSLVQRDIDPTQDDGEDLGFGAGDMWFNTETGDFFICGSAVLGDAKWASFASVPLAVPLARRDEERARVEDAPGASGGPATSV